MFYLLIGKHKQGIRKSLQQAPYNGIITIGVIYIFGCVVDGGGVFLCPNQV